ncbi:unnamed protein product [Choristocarpus tenellus]
MPPRTDLEVDLRRSLIFHCSSSEGESEGLEDEGTMFVEALLDDAQAGSIQSVEDLSVYLDDYLPNASLAPSEREEMLDDMLRDILKRFPIVPSGDNDDDDKTESDTQPGCCSMCERHMPLTRHHVMPRSSHKRYKKKGYSDEFLARTISICRPCHSAIHRTHDALTLAERFRTVESLLADEGIGRFVAWASKQKTTSWEDANNNLLHYPR